jgi:hypothetical protein
VPSFTDEQVLLTLAGLAYRGSADAPLIAGHAGRVHALVQAGLTDLAPVRGEWDLAWGPATSRERDEPFDSNMMYVVRQRRAPERLVIAIRGTSPVLLSDWWFGDFWVTTTVPWPYAPVDGAVVSTSTAFGLAALQGMQARARAEQGLDRLVAAAAGALGTVARAGASAAAALGGPTGRLHAVLGPPVLAAIAEWRSRLVRPDGTEAVRRALANMPRPLPVILRPRPDPAPGPGAPTDLVTWLAAEAASLGTPLDVTVTGHSKGAALAQAVALWLHETRASEPWEAGHGARLRCHAFAGPTPGNAAFARRFDAALGGSFQHMRNTNDIVTHAWQRDELQQIPTLYGPETALFADLVATLVTVTGSLDYGQPTPNRPAFAAPVDASRRFPEEFIHQHLDAYLRELGLDAHGIDALKLHIG